MTSSSVDSIILAIHLEDNATLNFRAKNSKLPFKEKLEMQCAQKNAQKSRKNCEFLSQFIFYGKKS